MTDYEKCGLKLNSLVSELREISVEKLNKQLTSIAADAIEQLVKERDAAIKDLFEEADSGLNTCLYCKKDAVCVLDCDNALWEWRGVQDETD